MDFSYEDCAIYYLFDCDRVKDEENVKELIKICKNSREPIEENEFDSIAGMLLLSYPAIETFIISNFEQDMKQFEERFDFERQQLKQYINDQKYDNCKISIKTIINSFEELVKSLEHINIKEIDLDNIEEFNQKIFDYERTRKKRYMLSLLLISFIDLGIIEFIE